MHIIIIVAMLIFQPYLDPWLFMFEGAYTIQYMPTETYLILSSSSNWLLHICSRNYEGGGEKNLHQEPTNYVDSESLQCRSEGS